MTDVQTQPNGLDPGPLQAALRGGLLQPGDTDFDAARQIYNRMIDRSPALIARCEDVADVIAAVAYARDHDLAVAVRGGGHNGAGLGICDDGLVIDLADMNGVYVDPEARTARVEGGATWGKVDHATHAYGLATPSGIISTTGVGGLTLGGGHGYLTRKYGLAIDNLIEADVVLADGRTVRASEHDNSDLFWALRGGGGNFGVITSFLFQLHPVDTVVGGPTLWDLDQTADLMRWYREFLPNAPDDLYGFLALHTVPPAPPFPEHLHLKKMCGVVWCYTGPKDRAEDVFAPVRAFGPPVMDGIGEVPYPALQSAFDGLYPPGMQWYWRGQFIDQLPDEAIDKHVEHFRNTPSMHSAMHMYAVDGAAHRVGRDDTAWGHRDAVWSQVIVGVDPDPANATTVRDWCTDYSNDLRPYDLGGGYVNFSMGDEGRERIEASFGGNYARLTRIKARYDPDNFFRMNHNIEPA